MWCTDAIFLSLFLQSLIYIPPLILALALWGKKKATSLVLFLKRASFSIVENLSIAWWMFTSMAHFHYQKLTTYLHTRNSFLQFSFFWMMTYILLFGWLIVWYAIDFRSNSLRVYRKQGHDSHSLCHPSSRAIWVPKQQSAAILTQLLHQSPLA